MPENWPATYNNPPIVEAIIDLKWASPLSWPDCETTLLDGLAEHYPVRQRLDLMQVSATVRPGGVAVDASAVPWRWMLRSSDQRTAVGLGPEGVSIHVMKPYPGWGVLRALAQQVHQRLQELVGDLRLPVEVGLRYIDQIALKPEGGANLADYFPLIGRRPPSTGAELAAIHHLMHTVDPTTGLQSILTIATLGRSVDARPVLLYDLQLRQPLADEGLDWLTLLDVMHARQRRIFEESISAHTRELFA